MRTKSSPAPAIGSFAELIDVYGGSGPVSKFLGVPWGTVSSMKSRDYVDVPYWPALVQKAQRIGRPDVTLELLAHLATLRRSRRLRSEREVAA